MPEGRRTEERREGGREGGREGRKESLKFPQVKMTLVYISTAPFPPSLLPSLPPFLPYRTAGVPARTAGVMNSRDAVLARNKEGEGETE